MHEGLRRWCSNFSCNCKEIQKIEKAVPAFRQTKEKPRPAFRDILGSTCVLRCSIVPISSNVTNALVVYVQNVQNSVTMASTLASQPQREELLQQPSQTCTGTATQVFGTGAHPSGQYIQPHGEGPSAGFPGQVNRTWKACRDKLAKMKTISRNQKALASQSGAAPSDWKYYERFNAILSGTVKDGGILGGLDQGVPKPPTEIVDLDDVPVSPRRAACLQPGVDGEPNKQLRKTQKHKREDTESVAASIHDLSTGL